MANFHPSNMVMVTDLSTRLNLNAVFSRVPIVYVNFVTGSPHNENPRIKVPFFGVNDIVVGLRFGTKSRGIRQTGGQLKNVIACDLQFANKNIHLKLSESKMTQVGALSEEMGLGAFSIMLEHIKMAADNWTHLHEYSKRSILEYAWSLKCAGDIPEFKDEWGCNTELDETARDYIGSFAHEPEFPESIIHMLSNEAPIYTQEPIREPGSRISANAVEPKFLEHRIANSVYNYNIGIRLSLIKTSRNLLEMGFDTSYHNWNNAKNFQALIADGDETKVSLHRFTVYQNGSIRQSSPSTVAEAYRIHKILVDAIMVAQNM